MNDWSGSEHVGFAVPVYFWLIRTSASVGNMSGSCRSGDCTVEHCYTCVRLSKP
jgi:hypothetical protein